MKILITADLHYTRRWAFPAPSARNARRQNFSAPTSRNISFPGTVINIPTWPEAVGSKRLTSSGCWCPGRLGRGISEPYRFGYRVGRGELADVEPGVDPGGPLARFPPEGICEAMRDLLSKSRKSRVSAASEYQCVRQSAAPPPAFLHSPKNS
jgi:hypothetical protein